MTGKIKIKFHFTSPKKMIRLCLSKRPRPSYKYFSTDTAAISECERLVKQYDNENYMCSLLLSSKIRSSILAIRAFNVEIATIRDAARNNALTGRLRFQFWKDVLDTSYSAAPEDVPPSNLNPIGRNLFSTIQKHGLERRWLNRLLIAREKELENEELSDIGDYEEYAEAVGSSLMYLSLQCGNIHENEDTVSVTQGGISDENAYRAAGHVGRTIGMVTLLRSIPMTAANDQRFTLPFWIMSNHGVKREDFLTGVSTQEMRDCVLEAATAANNQLLDAKQMQEDGEISPAAAKILLPAALAEDYLTRLENVDFDVFHPSLIRTKWENVKFMLHLANLERKGHIL